MSVKSLVVIPGLSSPFADSHRAVYDLLREASADYAWERSDVIVLPGQTDGAGRREGLLSFEDAVVKVCDAVRTGASPEVAFRFVGVSFGCAVALAAAADVRRTVEKVVLWGPIPLCDSWRAFRRGVKRDRLGRGTQFIDDETFFGQLVPVEHLLIESTFPVRVCVGTDDEYVPAAYLEFLRARAGGKPSCEFHLVAGCGHGVTADDGDAVRTYLDAVLG